MSHPVKTIHFDLSINDAAEQMFHYGHTGFPVINEEEELVGIISRRDVDKATRHDLGHAPVKAYMSTEPITLSSDATLETVQQTMIQYNIGRIPIVDNRQIVGIVSRSDVIEVLHNRRHRHHLQEYALMASQSNLSHSLRNFLEAKTYSLLQQIGEEADAQGIQAYLIGGIVRDLLLNRPNEDIDIVIEGDAIAFAHHLAKKLGGKIKAHEQFGTATWSAPHHIKLDLVTCRTEYYEGPATLPVVKASNIREDMARRDFTINAMALRINEQSFGELLDFFSREKGFSREKKFRILHTLSFIEDPTRIFRAVRFANRFQYRLSKQTAELARAAAETVTTLSKTRLVHELELMLPEENGVTMFKELEALKVWDALFQIEVPVIAWKHLTRLINNSELDMPFIVFLTALVYQQTDWYTKVKGYALTAKDIAFLKGLQHLGQFDLTEEMSAGQLHHSLYQFDDTVLLFAGLKLELESKSFFAPLFTKKNGHA